MNNTLWDFFVNIYLPIALMSTLTLLLGGTIYGIYKMTKEE